MKKKDKQKEKPIHTFCDPDKCVLPVEYACEGCKTFYVKEDQDEEHGDSVQGKE